MREWQHQGIQPKTQKQNINKDNQQAAGNRLRDLPEWLEEFTDNLGDAEVPASAHISHDSDRFGTTCESGIQEAQYFHSLPEGSKLRSMQEDQNYKGYL